MTLDDLRRRLRNVAVVIQRDLPSHLALRANLDGLARIQRRVIGSGVSADGSKFKPYSPGYAKQRRKEGRQAEHKSFERTGHMWRNIKVVKSGKTSEGGFAEIGAKDPWAEEKLAKNEAREKKGILDLSESETDKLVENMQNWLIEKIEEAI